MEMPPRDEYVANLGARLALNLGRLCGAATGGHCGLIGMRLETSPEFTADRICKRPEADCPGSTLIETAANETLAQMRAESIRENN